MQSMGLTHSMPFASFLEVVAATSNDKLDVHLLPQSQILCLDRQLIPNFVGHLETMEEDWCVLEQQLRRERLPGLGALPEKNVRRGSNHRDVPRYFEDSGLIRLVTNRYEEDLERFYGGKSAEQLIQGDYKN